jgi:hypothetical protein
VISYEKQLAFIAKSSDAAELKRLIANARNAGVEIVADAAFKKLISIVPGEEPGSVEYDFWQTINAFEHILSEENGRTTRLARTRQKVARVGVLQTLQDWALSVKETEGFKMLTDRKMAELSGEAIILRHADRFSPEVCAASEARLLAAGAALGDLNKTA